jgi:hypothetical protein
MDSTETTRLTLAAAFVGADKPLSLYPEVGAKTDRRTRDPHGRDPHRGQFLCLILRKKSRVQACRHLS